MSQARQPPRARTIMHDSVGPLQFMHFTQVKMPGLGSNPGVGNFFF